MNRQILCCGLEPIKNTALGKEFWVCQECKKEVEDRPEGLNSTVGPSIMEGCRWDDLKNIYKYFNNQGESNE